MKRLLVLLLAVAAVVALAAFYVPANAASVNGSTVSRQTLNADLSAIAGSPGFQCYLEADQQLTGASTKIFPVLGVAGTSTNPTTYNTAFARFWLSELLSNQLVAQLVAAQHLTVTPADLALGRVTLGEQITGVFRDAASTSGASCGTTAAALLASLPTAFRNEQIRVQAEQDVLLAHEAGYGLGTSSLSHYFTLHRAQFDKICLSYVAFSSQAAAAAARTQIQSGTPFAKTGTATPIGCALRYAINTLPTSVTSLPDNTVSQPVAGSNGEYALFEITSTTKSSFVAVRTGVENAILDAGSTKTTALIRVANKRAQVTADARYGQVAPGTVALLPPKSPPTSFVLNPAVNVPTSTVGQGSTGSQSG